MESPEVSSGKIYIGQSLPVKLDKSITTKNGDKPYDGTLAVTGPAFIGNHTSAAKGVLNVGLDLGEFKPLVGGRALDVEGDGFVDGKEAENSVYIVGDLYVSGKIDGGNKGRLAS